MKIAVKEKEGICSFISNNGKVKLENISCAVEWISNNGVLCRFESSTADAAHRKESKSGIHVLFRKNNCPDMEWKITKKDNNSVMQLSVLNSTIKNIRIKKIEPFFIDHNQNGKITIASNLNQARLLSFQRLCSNIKPQYLWEELYKYENFSSEMLLCLYDKATTSALNMGFISTADMFGKFAFSFNPFRKLDTFSAICCTEDIILSPSEKLFSEKLLINIDDSAPKGLENYALEVQKEMKSHTHNKPVTGWSTWDYYFGDISEDVIFENVDFLAEHREEFPVEYIQVDAGYTVGKVYDWENWNERFPHGPKWLVEKIKEKGFKAGLWLVPFWAHEKSELTQKHPDWLIKDSARKAVSVTDGFFALDGTHPEVQKYLTELSRKITQNWGFEYIKIDGASMIGMARGVHFNPSATSCQAYRQGLEAFRSGMKKGSFLMGGIFAPGIGIVDAMRIGSDVGARWDGSKTNVHAGERDRYHGCGNIHRAISSTLNASFMNKRLWINDGDYLIVRDDKSELSLNEARAWATVCGFYDGNVILGDRMKTLSQSRLEILKKIFPIREMNAIAVDFLQKEVPEILSADVQIANDNWKIVALLNYSESPALKKISFTDIGLDSKAEYHIFGFWEQKYHGLFMNSLAIPIDAHSCEIIAIRKNTDVPQLLGTDIHISTGGQEMESCRFTNNTLTIKVKNLRKEGNLSIFVPDSFMPPKGFTRCSANVWKTGIKLNGQLEKYVFNES